MHGATIKTALPCFSGRTFHDYFYIILLFLAAYHRHAVRFKCS